MGHGVTGSSLSKEEAREILTGLFRIFSDNAVKRLKADLWIYGLFHH
jgi:hypothetical protein